MSNNDWIEWDDLDLAVREDFLTAWRWCHAVAGEYRANRLAVLADRLHNLLSKVTP